MARPAEVAKISLNFHISACGDLPGVPAISTLNVRSTVLFSNGDPLWSLQDKTRLQNFTFMAANEKINV